MADQHEPTTDEDWMGGSWMWEPGDLDHDQNQNEENSDG